MFLLNTPTQAPLGPPTTTDSRHPTPEGSVPLGSLRSPSLHLPIRGWVAAARKQFTERFLHRLRSGWFMEKSMVSSATRCSISSDTGRPIVRLKNRHDSNLCSEMSPLRQECGQESLALPALRAMAGRQYRLAPWKTATPTDGHRIDRDRRRADRVLGGPTLTPAYAQWTGSTFDGFVANRLHHPRR